jgi:hypothetical protein
LTVGVLFVKEPSLEKTVNDGDLVSFPLAAALLAGALGSVPMLGWWPMMGVVAAIAVAAWFNQKLQ